MELRIEGINKHYRKKHALKEFSCVFNEGVNVLLGPNGAGKTTLMNCIADVINFDNGKIFHYYSLFIKNQLIEKPCLFIFYVLTKITKSAIIKKIYYL